MTDTILLIVKQEERERLCDLVRRAVKDYGVHIAAVDDAVQGLCLFEKTRPILLLVDADMPMLNGFSLSSIIKNTRYGNACTVYLIISRLEDYVKCGVDYYVTRPVNEPLLASQLVRFFEKRAAALHHKQETEVAMAKQRQMLPPQIYEESYSVSYIYSPFDELSGDGLDFWCGNGKRGLYGFLYDCTGHDIFSYSQTREIRAVFRMGFQLYGKSDGDGGIELNKIMQHVNEELFFVNGDNTECVAAVSFFLDFKARMLHYCSAGIPSFLTKSRGETAYRQREMINPLIGYEPDSAFQNANLSLDGIEEIIFSSDGFSDLLYKEIYALPSAQHDDVSAIFVQLKANQKEW